MVVLRHSTLSKLVPIEVPRATSYWISKLKLKKRIVKTLIWSTVLYAAETWMLRKVDITCCRPGKWQGRLSSHTSSKYD